MREQLRPRTMQVALFCMLASACGPDPENFAGPKFDGTYIGSITPGRHSRSDCFTAPSAQIAIVNGALEYKYFGEVAIFHAAVRDDGSFKAWAYKSGGNKLFIRLEGIVSQTSIEADTADFFCQNHLSLKRLQK